MMNGNKPKKEAEVSHSSRRVYGICRDGIYWSVPFQKATWFYLQIIEYLPVKGDELDGLHRGSKSYQMAVSCGRYSLANNSVSTAHVHLYCAGVCTVK